MPRSLAHTILVLTQLPQTRTRRVNSTIRTGHLSDDQRARGSHHRRRRAALIQARRAETKDRLGQLIGTTLDLPRLHQVRLLHRTFVHIHPCRTLKATRCHTLRLIAYGRHTLLVQEESVHLCLKVSDGLRVCETHQTLPGQTPQQIPARTRIQDSSSNATRMADGLRIRSPTCMPIPATSQNLRSYEERTNSEFHRPRRTRTLYHLQPGVRLALGALSRTKLVQAPFRATSRAGVRRAST